MKSTLNTKRLFSMLLVISLLFTAAFPAFAQTEAVPEAEEDYSISLLSGDITPPVILDVELLNNGNVSANDRYVYVQIEGYDSDGSDFSAQDSTIMYYVPNCMRHDQADGRCAESVTSQGNGVYTFKFSVDPTWYGPYTVVDLFISDDAGNTTRIEVMDEQTGNLYYKGTIARPVSAITASNVTINGSANDFTATLTDSITSVPYTFEADLALPANVMITDDLILVYKTQNNDKFGFNASYNPATGKIWSRPDIGYSVEEGRYTLDSIVYADEFLTVNGTVPAINVVKQNTDKTAPTVTDIWFEKNGTRVNNFEAQKGANSTDVVEVFVTVSDSSPVDRVEVNLQTAHPSYENPHTLHLQHVQGSTYSAQVPLDDYGATVWYVDDCYAYDIYRNMEPERHITPFFTLRDDAGDTAIPTMTFKEIEIEIDKDRPIINVKGPIVIEGITSLDEILSKIGASLGNVTIPSGVNFEGWYIGSTGSLVSGSTPAAAASTEFAMKNGGDYLSIAPKYDKLVLDVGVNYWTLDPKGRNVWLEERTQILMNHGATVQDALNQINLSQIQHHPDFVLNRYTCDGYDSTSHVLDPCNRVVWYSAEYASFPVYGCYTYYDQNGESAYGEFKLNANSSETHQDVLDNVLNGLNNLTLNHGTDYGQFLGWEAVPNWYFDRLTDEAAPTCYYEYTAVYEKRPVEVTAAYLDANGNVSYESLGIVTASNSTTYQDLVSHFAADLNGLTHSAKYGFTSWSVDTSSMTDVVLSDHVEIKAQYNSYPVTIVYTYQGTNGLTADAVQVDVPAGTNMENVFHQNVNPVHDSSLTHTGWKFYINGATDSEPSMSSLEYQAAAVYTDNEPVWVITAYVDKNNNNVQGPMVCYTQTTVNHNTPDPVIDSWVDDVKLSALPLVQALSKYAFTDFESIGYDINNHIVFSNYSTAPIVMLLPQTAKTEVTFNYPDGTSELKVLDTNSQYTLPTDYKGDSVDWIFDHPFGLVGYSGGDIIDLPPTFFTLTAEIVSGSGGAVPTPPTPTPTPTPNVPVNPSPSVTPTPTPAPTPTAPVELSQAAESQVISNIQQAAAGSVVKVNMTTSSGEVATVVTKEMLQAAQGKNVSIELDMGGYSWTIHGDDIKALSDIHDVNLEVTLDTNAIPSKVVQNLAGGKPASQLSLTYDGDFGFKADLTINVGQQYAGSTSSLYYYDSMGKLVFIDSSTIDANGNTSLNFSHASDYVVVVGMDGEKALTADEVKTLLSKLTPEARSSRTENRNIQIKVKLDKSDKEIISQIEEAGYTVKYNFYRSEKKTENYKSKLISSGKNYTNTKGTGGKMYYYKVRVQVYDENGKLIARTALNQCKYANRRWTK